MMDSELVVGAGSETIRRGGVSGVGRHYTGRLRGRVPLRRREMSELGRRMRLNQRGSWSLLGLLLVLAFLSHDVIMAAPAPALAVEHPSPALSQEVHALHTSSPHGCAIVRPAALETQSVPLGHSALDGVFWPQILTRPAGLSLRADMPPVRSPTASRALLQVFRI